MSGVVKGIKKVGKGIVKGVKKVFNAITSTTFGKIVLAAIVIYFGGAALGQWASGTAIDGVLVPAAAEAGAGTAAAGAVGEGTLAAGGTVGEFGTVGGAVTGTQTGVAGATPAFSGTGVGGFGTVGGAVPAAQTGIAGIAPAYTGTAGGFGAIAPAGGGWLSGSGLVVDAIKGIGAFAEANPIASAMGISALGSALSPTEAEGQMDLEKWRSNQVHKNMEGIGDVRTVAPGNGRITRPGGAPVYGPRGLIQSRMQGG
jgi:hypothetical protein